MDYSSRYKGIDFLKAGGYQRADEQHSAGGGVAGYRALYKTLKLVPIPGLAISWPNLKINIFMGKPEIGGVLVRGVIPTLRPRVLLLPEFINVNLNSDKMTSVQGISNMKFEFDAYQKQVPQAGYVEVLLEVDDVVRDQIMPTGRRRVSPILSILETALGERVLGSLIHEELIEIFPDGHWNRALDSLAVGTESQLDMRRIKESDYEKTKVYVDKFNNTEDLALSKRLILSADWYWRSEKEDDHLNRYIYLWISLEALAMPDTTNIKPAYTSLAKLTNETGDFWHKVIGRLHGRRSELVHGNGYDLFEDEVILLREVVKFLITSEILDVEQIGSESLVDLA